jgi:hypothetical protein
LNRNTVHDSLELRGVVDLTCGHNHGEGMSPSVGEQVEFGPETSS